MPRKGENIHERKDGRWEGRYKKTRDKDGNIVYGYVYAKSYGEVKEKMKSAQFRDEQYPETLNSDITLMEAALSWLEYNKISLKGGTFNKYRNIIYTHINSQIGEYKLSCLSSAVINSYLAGKLENGRIDGKGGLSPSYVNSIRIVLNSIINYAVNEQLMSPLKNRINKPVIPKKEISVLTKDECRVLQEFLVDNINLTKLGILLSLHTGLRIGEVCALKWEDIDFESETINVRHTISRVQNDNSNSKSGTKLKIDSPKTSSSKRCIPIAKGILLYLNQLRCSIKTVFVISGENEFLSPRTFEYRYHQILKKCGVPPANFHILRHTFATRCIEAGVDVKSLSEILGHSNVSITLNLYVHSSMNTKRKQMEKLYNYISS